MSETVAAGVGPRPSAALPDAASPTPGTVRAQPVEHVGGEHEAPPPPRLAQAEVPTSPGVGLAPAGGHGVTLRALSTRSFDAESPAEWDAAATRDWALSTETGLETMGLQYALNRLGAQLQTDGEPGPNTHEAVEKFFSRELPELAPGAGIDGQNRAEVRQLQGALNAATGGTIPEDGKFGPMTENALTEWQGQVGETAGPAGRVTRDTWEALLRGVAARVAENSGFSSSASWPFDLNRYNHTRVDVRLPLDDPNITPYSPQGRHYYYGTERTIEMLRAVAGEYNRRTGMALRVGDLSQLGGGDIHGHDSHEDGKNVDLDLAFNDGRTTIETSRGSDNATWRSSAYDRNATRTIVQLIKEAYPGAQILFNDEVLVEEGLVRSFPNHDNHMHVQRLY